MKIGIAKESAKGEIRVALLPREVKELIANGHEVFIQDDLGTEMGLCEDYDRAGAIVQSKDKIFKHELVVKLKAPTLEEFDMMGNNILFSMLHHTQNPQYVKALRKNKIIAVEMESIFNEQGERYVDCTDLTGEAGVLYALQHLKKIPSECKVLVLGYGRVSTGAIKICHQLGMEVKILRKNEYKNIHHFLLDKDMVINGVSHIRKPNEEPLISKLMLLLMNKFGIILDLSLDMPSLIETCHNTKISDPYYDVNGIRHICIYGYPGLYPVTSSNIYSPQICAITEIIADTRLFLGNNDIEYDIKKAIVE